MVIGRPQRKSTVSSTVEVEQIHYSKSRYNKYGDSGRNNVIPKVIETFQKATPRQEPSYYNNLSKKSSVQTLYRNKNSTIGRNVPKHKMMKELLQTPKEIPIVQSPSNKELVYRIANTSFDKKEFYSANFRLSPTETKISDSNSNMRVDKSTSITGLNQNQRSSRETAVMQDNNRKFLTNHYEKSKNKLDEKNAVGYNSSSSSIEQLHIKETSKLPLPYGQYIVAEPLRIRNNKTVYSRPPNNYQLLPEKLEKSNRNEALKQIAPNHEREKSFVKVQVEKLNKISNNGMYSKKMIKQNTNRTNKVSPKMRKDPNKSYLHMMNAVRKSVPKVDKTRNVEVSTVSTDFTQDWSDCNTDVHLNSVKFPKETKYAMEQGLKERRIPVQVSKETKYLVEQGPKERRVLQLSKFTKYSEDIRPAIAVANFSTQCNPERWASCNKHVDPYQNHQHFATNQSPDPKIYFSNSRLEVFDERKQPQTTTTTTRGYKNMYYQEPLHLKKGLISRDNFRVGDSHPVREVRPSKNLKKTQSGIPLRKKNTFVPCAKNLLCDRGDHNGPCNKYCSTFDK